MGKMACQRLLWAVLAAALLYGSAAAGESRDTSESTAGQNTSLGENLPVPLKNMAEPGDSAFGDSATKAAQLAGFEPLGGNLPKVLEDRGKPYLVTSDVYVPPGKTVRIDPGVAILFRNFTGLHVEGRLVVEGTPERPVVFSSEFDMAYNPASSLHANPYDWNGITIHENGLGSSFSHAKLMYSVFGINSLTKYFKLEKMFFLNNGRSDLVIEGKDQAIAKQPITYGLTIDDARKDGVPVKILMDPRAKKRNLFRYSGLTLLVGGCAATIASITQYQHDSDRLKKLSGKFEDDVQDENNHLSANESPDWEKVRNSKNLDFGIMVVGSLLTVLGGVGFGYSFTF
jgi:hypothetical protein